MENIKMNESTLEEMAQAMNEADEQDAKLIADCIAAQCEDVVQRVINRRYPSFAEYHETMRTIGADAIRKNASQYSPRDKEPFKTFIMPFVRQALREFVYGLGTVPLLKQYAVSTGSERDMIIEMVVEQNERLVMHEIEKYYSSYKGQHMEDMLQCGRMAIFLYSPKFDFNKINPKTGEPFSYSTFIAPYILDAIKNYICSTHNITPHYAVQTKKWHAAVDKLKKSGIENPTMDQIADAMGVGIDAAQKTYSVICRMNLISIEGDEKDKQLTDSYSSSPDLLVEQEEFKETVHRAILKLSKDEQQVVFETYFSHPGKEASMVEVGRKLHMDVPRVRRLLNKAKRELYYSVELSGITTSHEQRNLEEYTDDIIIDFVLPSDAVEANLGIAMSLDVEL